jgi:hypothetical protein
LSHSKRIPTFFNPHSWQQRPRADAVDVSCADYRLSKHSMFGVPN